MKSLRFLDRSLTTHVVGRAVLGERTGDGPRRKDEKSTTVVALFLMFLVVWQSTGCIMPAPRSQPEPPAQRIISNWDFGAVKPGTTVEIALFSGRKLKGKFRGIEPVVEEVYKERYFETRQRNLADLALPALGDKITVDDAKDNVYEGEFTGFDQGMMCARLPDRDKPVRFNLGMVRLIRTSDGRDISPGALIGLISTRKIPFRSAMIIDTPSGRESLPLEEVSSATITSLSERARAKTVFAIVGVCVALGITYALVKGMQDFSKGDWALRFFYPE
jgi:hypothetical protein